MSSAKGSMGMTRTGRSLLSGAAGAGLVVWVTMCETLPRPVVGYALVLGMMVFVGLSLLIPRRQSLSEILEGSGGLTASEAGEVERFVSECQAHVATIAQSREDIPDYREMIDPIVMWANRIIDNAKSDPTDIGRSTKFQIYLHETAVIVKKIISLRKKSEGIDSEVMAEIEHKATEALENIKVAFEQRFHSNLENNIRDVEVDLKVLKSTLDREQL